MLIGALSVAIYLILISVITLTFVLLCYGTVKYGGRTTTRRTRRKHVASLATTPAPPPNDEIAWYQTINAAIATGIGDDNGNDDGGGGDTTNTLTNPIARLSMEKRSLNDNAKRFALIAKIYKLYNG